MIGIIFPNYERYCAIASLAGIGALTFLYGYITTTALKNLRNELSGHIANFPQSSDDIKRVLQRLTIAYRILVVMSTLMGLSYFVFCFDYMLRKSSYLIIWLHISWPGVATMMVTTVSQITNREATSRFSSTFGRRKVMGIDNLALSSTPCEVSPAQSQAQSQSQTQSV